MSFVPLPSGVVISGYETDVSPPAGVVPMSFSTGVLHAIDSTGRTDPTNYWITDISLASQATALLLTNGFDAVTFTPYSSAHAWATAFPDEPLHTSVISRESLAGTGPPASAASTQLPTDPAGFLSPPAVQRHSQRVTPGTSFRQGASTPQGAHAPPPGAHATPPAAPPAATAAANASTATQQGPIPAGTDLASVVAAIHASNQAVIAQMQAQQQQSHEQLLTLAQSLTAPKALTAPTQTFPSWDGKHGFTKNLFLGAHKAYQSDPYFAGADWTKTLPGMEEKSLKLRNLLTTSLPVEYQKKLSRPDLEKDGFASFALLLSLLQPDSKEDKILATIEFGSLQQEANEPVEDYLLRCRDLEARVEGIKMTDLLPFHALCNMNHDLFPGLADRISTADPDLLKANLDEVDQVVARYKRIQKAMKNVPSADPSARRAKQQTGNPSKPPAPSPTPTPTSYPFPHQKWRVLTQTAVDHPDFCPGCGDPKSKHKSSGCPPWASKGWVVQYNPSAAKAIWEPFQNNDRRNRPGKERANRTSEAKSDDVDTKEQDGNSQASASRVSGDTKQSVPVPDDNPWTRAFDAMDSDDSDDGDDCDLDARLSDITGKTNTQSSSYLSNTIFSAATGPVTASARHVTAPLLTAAKSMLKTTALSVVLKDELNCCADSGATHHMLNDYAAFISYHPCQDEYVTLGDDTKLRIYGRGTAVFSLNGHNILVRDCLHVPDLRSPLYSLRKHRHMPGCGYISQFGVGSFILFPTFIVKVDDSEDNLVTFKPVGKTTSSSIEYRESK